MIKILILATAGFLAPMAVADTMQSMGHGSPSTLPADVGAPPTIIEGLGDGGYDAERATSAARAEFENGVRLDNAFSEEEAVRAFTSAEQLDPGCALCFWGEAAALAPTINYTVSPESAAKAVAALDRAQALAPGLSDKSRGIIAAERARYVSRDGAWAVDDDAAARAADALADQFPQDDALQSAAANADMIAAEHGRPGNAKADDPELASAQRRLDIVLGRSPNFTPALHFYLHLMEWQKHPERAQAYAERLGALAPEAGHLLHMASHIYYHTGRYEDAALANMRAAAADSDYVGKVAPPGGMAALPMHQHNLRFGLNSALLSGDAAIALKFAREMQAAYPPDRRIFAEAYLALGQFLPVRDMLAMPRPRTSLAAALYHFARGVALARAGNAAAVSAEAGAIAEVQAHGQFGDEDRRVIAMIEVARLTLLGRAAMLRHDWPTAITRYRQAALFADKNEPFADPPFWPWPPRRSLAAALLAGGHAEESRQEAETTLKKWPNDGVTLHVLAEASARLGDPGTPSLAARAKQAWQGSAELLNPALI